MRGDAVDLRGRIEILRIDKTHGGARQCAGGIARIQPAAQIGRQGVDEHRRARHGANVECADTDRVLGLRVIVGVRITAQQMQLRFRQRLALAHDLQVDEIGAQAVLLAPPARAESEPVDADVRQEIVLVVERDRRARGQHQIGEIDLGAHFADFAVLEPRPDLQLASAVIDDKAIERIVAQHCGQIDLGAAEIGAAAARAAVVFEHGVDRRRIVFEIAHAAEHAQEIAVDDQTQFLRAELEMRVVRQVVDIQSRVAHDDGAETEQGVVVEALLLVVGIIAAGIEAADLPLPLRVAHEVEFDAGKADFGPARIGPRPGEEIDLQARARQAQRLALLRLSRGGRRAEMHAGEIEQRPGAFPARVELVDRDRPVQHLRELGADRLGVIRDPRQHDELGQTADDRHQDRERRQQPEQPPLRAVQVAVQRIHGVSCRD